MVSTPALDLRWNAGAHAPAFRDLLYAALDDFAPTAIHDLSSVAPGAKEDAEDGWRVFFKDAALRDRAADALGGAFRNDLIELRAVDVPDEDWARRSQAHLHAVRVGGIVVAPPWDPVASGFSRKSPIVITIDPSTGFGTGHHETTRLCLALLQDTEVTGGRVIDVGTGSGILAIAAARLGARDVIALDDDVDALANAAENLRRNCVEGIVSLVHDDLAHFKSEPGRVVTANLTGAVLQRHARTLRALVGSDGDLIVSGFSRDESADVVAALGASVEREMYEGDWAAARLRVL